MSWIVIDWHHTEVFGPFFTKDEAEDWLAKQGIHIGEYADQEVSVTQLKSQIVHKLKEAVA